MIVKFTDIEINDILTEAIGVFKIENKSDFFQTYVDGDVIELMLLEGISTKKLDKGCLILNTTDADGKYVLSVDNNTYDAQYWIKNFLNLKAADDSNSHTKNYLDFCASFGEEVIKENFGKKQQSEFLAETIDFFKENENVNIEDFKTTIFEEEKYVELFDDYKKQFEAQEDVVLRNNFFVSDKVLKKEKSNSNLKLN